MRKRCLKCNKLIPKRYLHDHERMHNQVVKRVWNTFLDNIHLRSKPVIKIHIDEESGVLDSEFGKEVNTHGKHH